ncbi:hypothetical protein MASR2M17_16360 [Aminivibrio sp.]
MKDDLSAVLSRQGKKGAVGVIGLGEGTDFKPDIEIFPGCQVEHIGKGRIRQRSG